MPNEIIGGMSQHSVSPGQTGIQGQSLGWWPWYDYGGRLSPLKLTIFVALFVPGCWVAAAYGFGLLGARPLNEAIREIGLWTIRLVFLALAVTPLRQALRWPQLIIVRRMIGVAAFAYVLVHFSLYTAQQAFD